MTPQPISRTPGISARLVRIFQSGLGQRYGFAIQFPNGDYWTGLANTSADQGAWRSKNKEDAVLMGESYAQNKRDNNKCFQRCVITRLWEPSKGEG